MMLQRIVNTAARQSGFVSIDGVYYSDRDPDPQLAHMAAEGIEIPHETIVTLPADLLPCRLVSSITGGSP